MWKTGYNGTDGPVLVDNAEGLSLGGGEWGPVETTDDAVKAAVSTGALVLIDTPPDQEAHYNASARSAISQTQTFTERSEQLDGLDKPALRKLAEKAGLVAEDADPSVAQLRASLVRSDVPLPTKRKSTAAASASDKS